MDKRDAARVAERVLQAFDERFELTQGERTLGASVGISIFPEDGTDAGTLLHNADIAMFSVKQTGKGSFRFFDPYFYERLRIRIEKELELREAIEKDQFTVYYQPRVDMATGAVCSMEALIRWMHPTKGVIGPIDFVPLAEETGLILALGEIVVEKVCAQMASWSRRHLDLVPVSVNVSSRQFHETDVTAIFSNSMKSYHVDPALIEIDLIMFVPQNSAVLAESNLSQWLSYERGDDGDQWNSVSEGVVLGCIPAGLRHRGAV